MPDDDIPSAQEPNELNDSPGGHLPYDPPTPAELHDLFESPEEMAYQRKLAQEQPPAPEPPEPEPPGGESVVPDLQPIVETDFSRPGEHLDEPPEPAHTAADGAAPPDGPAESVLDQIQADTRLASQETAREAQLEPYKREVERLEHKYDDLDRDGLSAHMRNDTAEETRLAKELDRTEAELEQARANLANAPAVESVTPDLQPVVETDLSEGGGPGGPPATEPPPAKPPAEISLETPPDDSWLRWQIPRWSSVRLPIPGKPVLVWGVAVGVGVAGVVTAVALLGGGRSHAHAAAPAAAAPTAAAPTTAAAPAAPAPETSAAAPADEPPTVSPISAVLTNRPPPPAPKKQTDCGAANNPCLGLPLKPLTVRYTTYTVHASDPGGHALTYRWANTNSCGVFRATGPSAVWSFPEPGTCPKGVLPKGTVSVVVSDGKHACTATYPAGSAPGRGPTPACKPG